MHTLIMYVHVIQNHITLLNQFLTLFYLIRSLRVAIG